MDVTWDDPKINSPGTPSEEGLNQVYHSNFLKCANDTKFMNLRKRMINRMYELIE